MGVLYVTQDKPVLSAGREESCDLVIQDPFVSRSHLRFVSVAFDVALVMVLGSNGAVIDNEKVNKGAKTLVRCGDSIRIGKNILVYIGAKIPDTSGFVYGIAHLPEPDDTPVEIEAPPPRKMPEKPSIVLAAGPALTMAIPILLGAGRSVAILSSVFAVVWAASGVILRARRQKAQEKRRKNTYYSYIDERKETIRQRLKEAADMMNRLHPRVSESLKDGPDPFIVWNLSPDPSGRLAVRIGSGKVPAPFDIVIPKERFAGIDDSLKELPETVKMKYSRCPGPVMILLEEKTLSGFVLKDEKDRQMLSAFILQLAVSYPPDRVRIFMDLPKELMRYLMWAVCLPHYIDTDTIPDEDNVITVIFTDDGAQAGGWILKNTRIILVKPSAGDFPAGVCKVINEAAKGIRQELIPRKLCFSYAAQLSSLWQRAGYRREIPSVAPFGAMFEEELSEDFVARSYDTTDITAEFAAPIGIADEGRVISLDLHEKGAGPHGLIAGTTGSGKSELLTTLILSFAIRFPADKLAFFLIDYKGGGMSNLFSDLPHVAGTVSNLSKTLSSRAMIALKSENIRRQEIFAKNHVNNINDYTKLYDSGLVKEPLPHILIVVDEFAELKSAEPEFMDRLISISQVGRSLGMHLILATQKPSGVVDDRIRANSRFKIALRLVDRADSMDMLNLPDAAGIKECGRAYLQVGNNEVFELFQSGYAMGPMHLTERPQIYEDLLLVRKVECADRGAFTGDDEKTWYMHVCDIAKSVHKKRGTTLPRPLWMEPLPDTISDDRAYAILDDPYETVYKKAFYEPERTGHIWITGRSGSGKSSLIRTLIARISQRASIYIIDHGGGLLKDAAKRRWCGGYVGDDCPDDIPRMTGFICEEMMLRRRTAKIAGLVVLVLDNLPEVGKMSETAYGHIQKILSFGKSAGVYIIASSLSLPSVREQKQVDTGIYLGGGMPYDAADLLKVSPRDIPDIPDIAGRGVCLCEDRVLQLQAVLPPERLPDNPANAPPFPHVPDKPTLEDLLAAAGPPGGGGRIPIGYEVKSGKVFFLPTEGASCILIGGKPYNGRHTLLFNISVSAARSGIKTVRADTYESLRSVCDKSTGFGIVVIESIGRILDEFYETKRDHDEEDMLCHLFDNTRTIRPGTDNKWIVTGIIENDVAIRHSGRKIFESIRKHPFGIVFGGGLDEGRIFDFSYMNFTQTQMSQTRGYATIPKYDEKTFFGQIKVPCVLDVDNSQTL